MTRNWIVSIHYPDAEGETEMFGPYTRAAAEKVKADIEALSSKYGSDAFATAHPIEKWKRADTVAEFKAYAEYEARRGWEDEDD